MEMTNFIEILMDEFGFAKNVAEKAFIYANEKMKEVSPDLSLPEQIDDYLGKFGLDQEKKDFFKDKMFSLDLTTLEVEEAFRKGIQFSKEYENFAFDTPLPKEIFCN